MSQPTRYLHSKPVHCSPRSATPSFSKKNRGRHASGRKLPNLSPFESGIQSGHIKLRNLLVSFIESNTSVLGGLCNGTVQSHCSNMRKASTFGTQAELQAAASLFQVMIYIFDSASEERRL